MAEVKRSYAFGALAAIGVTAAGVAAMWNAPEQPAATLDPAVEATEGALIPDDAATGPDDVPLTDRRKLAMSGPASEIQRTRKEDRIGSFRTVAPGKSTLLSQSDGGGAAAAPIEFIVKLKDRALIDDLRALHRKAPEQAAARLKAALGGAKLIQGAHLQGFTLGGEAILRWDGPANIDVYAARQDEIQRVLSALPAVSYAEQNYTADINSAQ